jgi:hypothetical protein
MYIIDEKLQDADNEMIIWKYMSFTSFYRMLFTRALFFRRLDNFTDDLEGTLPEDVPESVTRHAPEEYKAFTLANAWSLNNDESYAMWKIYLHGNSDGIALKSTVGKLKGCLDKHETFEIYCGKVTYSAEDTIPLNHLTAAFSKHPTYSYENEYRALICDQFIEEEHDGVVNKKPRYEVGADVTINCSMKSWCLLFPKRGLMTL